MHQPEIRDPDLAKTFLLESLLLSRAQAITPDTIELGLRLAIEITSEGSPLPPLGFVMDIGLLVSSLNLDRNPIQDVPGLSASLARQYEDYVLGKFYADSNVDRASDALANYSGRDRDRAIAFVITQVSHRCGVSGTILSPAVIKTLAKARSTEVYQSALELVSVDGISPERLDEYRLLIDSIQNSGELLAFEDVFELEQGTALAEFGQRIALRQTLKATAELEKNLASQKPRTSGRHRSVATNILEEDSYPVGGFSSISNKGTIESLLRSELAYIDDQKRPDLFDIKFARNELLYYSRDENQFLRRRLSFVFALHPELKAARFKDPRLEFQRIILLLALIHASIRRLSQWLTDDSLQFHILMIRKTGLDPLDEELDLLNTIFQDRINSGTVILSEKNNEQAAELRNELARTSLCQTLHINTRDANVDFPNTQESQLILEAPQPTLCLADQDIFQSEEPDLDAWREALNRLLAFWI